MDINNILIFLVGVAMISYIILQKVEQIWRGVKLFKLAKDYNIFKQMRGNNNLDELMKGIIKSLENTNSKKNNDKKSENMDKFRGMYE